MTVTSIKQNQTYDSFIVGNDVYARSYFSIATTTVSSGGSSSVTFNSIPNTYTHLQLKVLARSDRADNGDTFYVRFNSDTGNNYTFHVLSGEGTTVGTYASSSTTAIYQYYGGVVGDSAGANIFGVTVMDILDYANTNKYKTVRQLDGQDRNGAGSIEMCSGAWLSTNAITSISITPRYSTKFLQYSSIALYGIKSA